MSEPQLPREVRRRLAIIQHAEEVTGNVAMTCRYYGISRQVYYRWLRRYQEQGTPTTKSEARTIIPLVHQVCDARGSGQSGSLGWMSWARPPATTSTPTKRKAATRSSTW